MPFRASLYLERVSTSKPPDKEAEAASFRRMEKATLRDRRRRYRETTPGQRIEAALELSELARELKTGLRSSG